MNINDLPTGEVRERDLKLLMKDWRSGRATKTLWEAIQDAYMVVLAVAVFGAMIIQLLLSAQGSAAGCTSAGCQSARTLLPWAALAGVAALAVAGSRLFGPVVASAAEGFWLMDAPINRAKLLGSRLVSALLLAVIVGAASGALIAALTGSPPVAIGVWALGIGLVGAGLVAFSAAEQGVERMWITRIAVYLFSLACVGSLLLVVSIAAGWTTLNVSTDKDVQIAAVMALLGAVILVLAGVLAFARLNRIRRARLVSGGSLVSGMAGAMYALDLGLARDIVVARNALERGHVRPKRGRGVGVQAIIWRDLQRLQRSPQVLLPVLATAVVPYACVALGLTKFTPMLSALALLMALIPLLGGLRVLTRTLGLSRALPFEEKQIRSASIAVAAGLAVLWGMVTTPAMATFGKNPNPVDTVAVAMLTAAAGLLGAVRWTVAKPIDFGQPMLATQAGALPPGMLTNMIRGLDIVLLMTGPLVFGLPWWVSVLLGVIAYWFLMGNFNMEALKEQQEEQRKILEQQRAERTKMRK